MSPQMSRRLHALLAAPLLLMSCLSNFYFFCGAQVFVSSLLALTGALYVLCAHNARNSYKTRNKQTNKQLF